MAAFAGTVAAQMRCKRVAATVFDCRCLTQIEASARFHQRSAVLRWNEQLMAM
jgi:hypothetical protein